MLSVYLQPMSLRNQRFDSAQTEKMRKSDVQKCSRNDPDTNEFASNGGNK